MHSSKCEGRGQGPLGDPFELDRLGSIDGSPDGPSMPADLLGHGPVRLARWVRKQGTTSVAVGHDLQSCDVEGTFLAGDPETSYLLAPVPPVPPRRDFLRRAFPVNRSGPVADDVDAWLAVLLAHGTANRRLLVERQVLPTVLVDPFHPPLLLDAHSMGPSFCRRCVDICPAQFALDPQIQLQAFRSRKSFDRDDDVILLRQQVGHPDAARIAPRNQRMVLELPVAPFLVSGRIEQRQHVDGSRGRLVRLRPDGDDLSASAGDGQQVALEDPASFGGLQGVPAGTQLDLVLSDPGDRYRLSIFVDGYLDVWIVDLDDQGSMRCFDA